MVLQHVGSPAVALPRPEGQRHRLFVRPTPERYAVEGQRRPTEAMRIRVVDGCWRLARRPPTNAGGSRPAKVSQRPKQRVLARIRGKADGRGTEHPAACWASA